MGIVWLAIFVVAAGGLVAGLFVWRKSKESANQQISKPLNVNGTIFDISGSLDEFTITVDERYVFNCKSGSIIESGDKRNGQHLQSYMERGEIWK